MKQIMRKAAAVAAVLALGLTASAQMSIGGGALYTGYNSQSFIGGGLKGFYEFKDNASASLEVNYSTAKDFSIIRVQLGAQKYFFGADVDSDFGIYGGLKAGYMLNMYKGVDFDYSTTPTTIVETDETASGLDLHFGLGSEIGLDFGKLFVDAYVSLPANKQNGQAIAVEILGSYYLQAGVRIPLD